MIQHIDYFYDRQQERFLEQIIRGFSGFQYKTGSSGGNPPVEMLVPCRMATTNRVVANIMRNQSENTLLTVPMITVWQTALTGTPDRLQNRSYVDSRQVVEREIVNNIYTENDGRRYTVDRIMPLPFEMKIQIDIWTSNLSQKYQLSEQILTAIYPSFDIQNSQNALDWSALTTAYVEDINYSSRSIPIGTSDEIDVMTITLRIPIWLSPPAKIKQQKIINQIITNINDTARVPGLIYDSHAGNTYVQIIVTPEEQHISVSNGVITYIQKEGQTDPTGNAYVWSTFLKQYGELRPSSSELTLLTTTDINGPGVTGTFQIDPSNALNLLWQIDPSTLPANTLPAVNAIINPVLNYPGDGSLPAAVDGQRYLLVHDIGNSVAWGTLSARYGDIIQYNVSLSRWVVSFSAFGSPPQYVVNLQSGRQLKWTGSEWMLALDGVYGPGYWRLRL
jgi:hypothetical protein